MSLFAIRENWEEMEVVTILVLLVLNIALPTLDTFTDIKMVYKLYRGAPSCPEPNYTITTTATTIILDDSPSLTSPCPYYSHPKMATVMLTPFLLNYLVCFITFLRKEKYKKFTFIFALLNIYPQFGINNH